MSKVNQSIIVEVVGGLVAGGASLISSWGGRKISFCPNIPYTSSAISGASFGVSLGVAMYNFGPESDQFNKFMAIYVILGAVLTTAGNKLMHGKNVSFGSCLGISTVSAITPFVCAYFIPPNE